MPRSIKTVDTLASSRKVFEEDIEETKQYLKEFKQHVETLCEQKGLKLSRMGRGHKAIFPNFTYALHYRLQGITPFQAAMRYITAERGRTLQPITGGVFA